MSRRRYFGVLLVVILCAACAPAPAAGGPEDEGRKVVAAHAEQMEKEAEKLRPKNEPAAELVARAAKLLRLALAAREQAGADDPRGPVHEWAPADIAAVGPRPAGAAKAVVLPLAEFNAKHARTFPRDANLARGGRASASTTHPTMDAPLTALGGGRKFDTWALQGAKGWFAAEWADPPAARYVLVFNRPGSGPADAWQGGTLEINGRAVATVASFTRGQVLVADLGEPVAVKSVRLTIQGRDNPGVSGVELHRGAR